MILIFLGLFLLIWILSGLIAFIMSIVCFGYNGKTSYKIIGFVIAFFFGPFFWLYYIVNKDYCVNNNN